MESKNLSLFGKTSQESYQAWTTPLGAFWERLPAKAVSFSQQGGGGQTLVISLDPKGQSHGGSSMPNISEWPNDADVCLLSQVLEQGSVQQRYYLSSRACAGILRRAATRGRELPPLLKGALLAQAVTVT